MAVKVRVTADKTEFDSAMKSVDARLGSFGAGAMGQIKGSFTRAGAGLLTAFLGVEAIRGFGAAMADVVSTSGRFETIQSSFNALIGDAEKAKGLFEDIKTFEAKSPLGLEDLMAASKQLLAFGVTTNQIVPTLKMLGDISAATNIPIGEMADLFGRNKTQGTLMTKDIREFTGRGIPIQQALVNRLGLSNDEAGIARLMKMVEAGKINADLMEAALIDLTSAGGKFFGQTEIQAQTLEGKLSTLQSAFNSLKATMGDAASGITKDMASGLTDVASNLEAVMKYRKEAARLNAEEEARNAKSGNGSGFFGKAAWFGGAMLSTAYGYAGALASYFTGGKMASTIFPVGPTADPAKEEAEARKQQEENIAKRRRAYLEDIQAIEDQTLFDRKSVEEKIAALREKQATFLQNNSFDLALEQAKEIAKLEADQWKSEQGRIEEAGKKKLSYEEEVRAIAEQRMLSQMGKEQQLAYLRQQEAKALAAGDYDKARATLRQRASLEDSGAGKPVMGVADSLRRIGGLGGYFAPQKIQEKSLTAAEKSRDYLASIDAEIKKLTLPTDSWTEMQ